MILFQWRYNPYRGLFYKASAIFTILLLMSFSTKSGLSTTSGHHGRFPSIFILAFIVAIFLQSSSNLLGTLSSSILLLFHSSTNIILWTKNYSLILMWQFNWKSKWECLVNEWIISYWAQQNRFSLRTPSSEVDSLHHMPPENYDLIDVHLLAL